LLCFFLGTAIGVVPSLSSVEVGQIGKEVGEHREPLIELGVARALPEVAVTATRRAEPLAIRATERGERHLDPDHIADHLLGLGAARELIERLFEPRMEAYVRGEGDRDYKTILQELASQELRALPVYQIQDRGPDHQKEFTATVVIAGETLGTGVGRSKKEAEQQAAREAHARISERRAARPVGGSGDGAS
jgi:hypothetical protein